MFIQHIPSNLPYIYLNKLYLKLKLNTSRAYWSMKAYFKYSFFALIWIFQMTTLLSQKYDYIWVFGYSGDSPNPRFEASNLDFNYSPPRVFPSNRDLDIGGIGTAVCDEWGNLVAFTNGAKIYNSEDVLMQNGDSLDIGFCFQDYYDSGYPYFQSAFWVPTLNNDSSFWLFHFSCTDTPELIERAPFLMTKIKKSGSQFIVSEEKNIQVHDGNFDSPSACKHANGRDWWIILPNYISENTNYNIFLLTPEGMEGPFMQDIGVNKPERPSGGIKTGFSKDGTCYVRTDAFIGMQFFDFDRCSGAFSNFRLFDFENPEIWFSANREFSANGQYYYFTSNTEVYQLDLFADTLNWDAVDTVAIYDGFVEWGTSTTFFMCQRGPDDKIYISCTTSAPYLHVIHDPNVKGINCDVEQHAIRLAGRHAFSIPYYPNYRLGPLENSPCDTITSSQSNLGANIEIRIFPNPASENIQVVIENPTKANLVFRMINIHGQEVKKSVFSGNSSRNYLDVSSISPGFYFYEFRNDRALIKVGNLVIN